jgi:carbon storage regulator
MLVLSRRKDETIMIGDSVEITVVDVRGDTVRLGITAPRTVSVHRKEIYDAIQAENIAAAQEPPPDSASVGGLGNLLKGVAGMGGAAAGDAVKPSSLSKLTGGAMLTRNDDAPPARGITRFSPREGPQKRKN